MRSRALFAPSDISMSGRGFRTELQVTTQRNHGPRAREAFSVTRVHSFALDARPPDFRRPISETAESDATDRPVHTSRRSVPAPRPSSASNLVRAPSGVVAPHAKSWPTWWRIPGGDANHVTRSSHCSKYPSEMFARAGLCSSPLSYPTPRFTLKQ